MDDITNAIASDMSIKMFRFGGKRKKQKCSKHFLTYLRRELYRASGLSRAPPSPYLPDSALSTSEPPHSQMICGDNEFAGKLRSKWRSGSEDDYGGAGNI